MARELNPRERVEAALARYAARMGASASGRCARCGRNLEGSTSVGVCRRCRVDRLPDRMRELAERDDRT